MKKRFAFLIIFLVSINLYGQDIDSTVYETPSSVSEVIEELGTDSVKFYYNDRYRMVKSFCATRYRITRIDTTTGNFEGMFTDYFQDSGTAITGSYKNGKKEGLFTIYYPNGQVEQTGKYSNNSKAGLWEYYYPDGSKHQTFLFTAENISVEEFWDENGKKLVESGNGFWYGYETAEKFRKISGKVVNGKKEGTWVREIPSQKIKMNTEKYENGKLISNKTYSVLKGVEKNVGEIYCLIEQPPSFLAAELFQISQCEKNINVNRKPAYFPGGMNRFTEEVIRKLNLTAPVNRVQNIRIAITIDLEGNMNNFKALSNTGFEYDVINLLKTMDKWEPATVNGKPQTENRIIAINLR